MNPIHANAGAQPRVLPFVGRDQLLSELHACVERDQMTMLVGDAGVGKTRILTRYSTSCRSNGRLAFDVFANATTSELPLAAVAGMLAELGVADVDAYAAPWQIIARAIAACRAASGDGLPIIAVDDANHLDNASATLVATLVRERAAIAVLSLRRDARLPESLHRLRHDTDAHNIDVGPLSDVELIHAGELMLGGLIDAHTRARLLTIVRGNALFLVELLRAGLTLERLDEVDGVWKWHGPIAVGDHLIALVRAEHDAAPKVVRELVDILAVAAPLPVPVLAGLIDENAIGVAERLGLVDVADSRGVLVVRLAHPLHGEVARADIPAFARSKVAARIADAIRHTSRLSGSDLRLASLDLQSGSCPDVELVVGAARRARTLGDFELAGSLAMFAIRHGAVSGVVVVLADTLLWRGRLDEFSAIADSIDLDKLDVSERATAECHRASARYYSSGDFDGAIALITEAKGVAGIDEARLSAHHAELAMLAGRYDDAIELGRQVIEKAGASIWAQAAAHSGFTASLALSGRTHEAGEAGERGLQFLFSQPEPPVWEGAGIVIGQFIANLLDGSLLKQLPILEGFFFDAQTRPGDPLLGAWGLLLGRAQLAVGSIAEGVATLRLARSSLTDADPGRLLPWCLGSLAQALAQSAERAELDAVAADLMSRPPLIAATAFDREIGVAWASVRVSGAAAAGALAHGAAQSLAADGAHGAAALALVEAFRLGARISEIELVDALERCDGDAVRGALGGAIACEQRNAGEALSCALTLADLGYLLWAGDVAAAAAQVARIEHDTRTAVRAEVFAKRCLGRCAGAFTPRTSTMGLDQGAVPLSPRERSVALLAASGLSNPEIAEQIGIGRRTVETHMANIFTKLGIASRREIAMFVGDN